MEEPRLGERYWEGLPGGSGLGMEGGTLTEARLSGHRDSTWDTDSGTACSHESLYGRKTRQERMNDSLIYFHWRKQKLSNQIKIIMS